MRSTDLVGAARRCLPVHWIGMLVLGWGIGIAGGFMVLMDYQNAPGRPAEAPTEWPAETVIPREDTTRGTLVVFAHPHCPCTRATMNELERLMRYVQGRVATHVLFVQPVEYDRTWVEGELWRRATSISGVVPRRDVRGVEARRFGAFTSGQVLYYDADGRLRFVGGITGARGHEGNNKGRQALTDLIMTGTASRTSTFVFGCALQEASLNDWKRLGSFRGSSG